MAEKKKVKKENEIINETKLEKENIKYLTKLRLKSPSIICYRLFVIIIGIMLLITAIIKVLGTHPDYKTFVASLFISLFMIYLALHGLKFIIYSKSLKASCIDIIRKHKFGEKEFYLVCNTDEGKIENKMEYNVFNKKIIKHNDYYYMSLANQKLFLIIDVNGFKNKDDNDKLIKIFKSNGMNIEEK